MLRKFAVALIATTMFMAPALAAEAVKTPVTTPAKMTDARTKPEVKTIKAVKSVKIVKHRRHVRHHRHHRHHYAARTSKPFFTDKPFFADKPFVAHKPFVWNWNATKDVKVVKT